MTQPPPVEAADFDYHLPAENIAQAPAADRSASRLLVDLAGQPIEHRTTAAVAELVEPGDVLVINDTKVIPARVRFRRPTGGAAELLLLEPDGDPGNWQALVRPSKKLVEGLAVDLGNDLVATFGSHLGDGRRIVHLSIGGEPALVEQVHGALDGVGELPLPPYITDPVADESRYQTVYATHAGSSAAPTAGLHLTPEILAAIEAKGATVARVQLVVGLDTFRPLSEGSLDDHQMHTERYVVPAQTWEQVQAADRVVAVGTTVVRALESAAASGELAGRTDLFIRSPYDFAVVDRLLTNFHLPKSTLLVLLEAFIGPRWRELYELAIGDGYRMLSFGDAMFVSRH